MHGRQLDGREDWIRTSGLLLPKQALYQAELPPDEGSVDGTEGRAGGAPPAGKHRHREGLLTAPRPVKRALSGQTALQGRAVIQPPKAGRKIDPGDA